MKRSPALAREICHLIADGSSTRQTAAQLGLNSRFIFDWCDSSPEFSQQYARAKERAADVLADDLVEISDSATVRDAHVARLKVDTRKWIAAKLLPKKYGDRPNEINVNTQINLATLSIEDQAKLQARRQELLKEQGE